MALSKVSKIVVGALTTGGVSGAGAYTYYELTKETIKDKLGDKLLDFGTTDNTKWKARADILAKDQSTTLSAGLAKIKQEKDTDGSKVKGWCEKNIKNKFVSEEDSLFQEIRKYCTYHIKDKVGVVVEETWSSSNSKNNDKLKKVNGDAETKLSATMKNIKAKLSASDTTKDDNALKTWCLATYEKPFEKEDTQEIEDVKEYCAVITQ
ncbi:hypothetical protein A6V39_03795 [Candidatus Mycoplasma haematobovis]|uniref:Uncharacterized protein n=1 Tax=Candidatus Mycoplasma haematobovis TaxID=432608 RepID=A0A1A9QE94_9MOLU|nr:hypothetical protein [Candidatus Mycoplasma haematobovis]OAL10010.1 hypothetical protein A6V39_03795 [Candidatus Mycoplasma haematobovis]